MSGRSARRKGSRIERELVALHRAAGIPCERVPLSGGAGGRFAGDLIIGEGLRAEVKARRAGAGFTLLERWLADRDVLFLRRDRSEPLVVIPFGLWTKLLKAE